MYIPANLPDNEDERLKKLQQLLVLDSDNEIVFDDITKLANSICGTPIALVSLVDKDRQWFKCNIGLPGAIETPRDIAFCSHAILNHEVMEVCDARLDPRFADNPLVTGAPYIRFYAGAPITIDNDFNIGTLCVIDQKVRQLSDEQKRLLCELAKVVGNMLILRQNTINQIRLESHKLANIIEFSEDAIISKSLDGIVTSWNKSAERTFGYSAEEMIGQSIIKLFPENRMGEEPLFLNAIINNQHVKHYETERFHKNGDLLHLSVTLSPIKDALGNIIGISKIARDISETKRLQLALQAGHERLKITMDSIGDAVITTDKEGNIEYINPVAEKLTGWALAEARGLALTQVFTIINENTRQPAPNPARQCMLQEKVVGLANYTLLIAHDGSEHAIEDSASPIRDAQGNITGAVVVFHDVTAQRKMATEMSYRATHDSLTGLINRAELEHYLQITMLQAREDENENCLLFIDLDQFKIVNDTCGHLAGDKLLIETVKIIKKNIRELDYFARIGGDEFGIILPKCDVEPALRIANSICKSLDEYRFHHSGKRFRIGASIGVVSIDSHWPNVAALLQAADSACYLAKENGRNRAHLYADAEYAFQSRRSEVQWASKIEQALEDESFELLCQRIQPMNREELCHGEILIRMRDTDGSLISPGMFLPAAERFHMISRIDRWVVKSMFHWIKENDESLKHFASFAINISGQSLNDDSFQGYVIELIKAIKIDYNKVTFEITETAAITHINEAIHFMNAVKKFGVSFSLDDFGSGVSSFGYLKKFPVDYLKIDGQFIRSLPKNPIDQATVKCIIEVAKVTNKKTIAEWVEDAATYNLVKEMGIDYCQGYFHHKPAPLQDILDFGKTFKKFESVKNKDSAYKQA